MIFRSQFCAPKICCPRSIQATHTHACHSEVSIRFFWFVVFKAISCGILQKSAHVSKNPLPLRAAARSTSSTLLHHSQIGAAEEQKDLSHADKQRVWSRSCGLQDLF